MAEKMRKNVGGHTKAGSPKVAVSLRLVPERVSRFNAEGPDWQARMNWALRLAAGQG
nr:BrnA antitoxin family protein [Pararhodobacter sp. CCB-MM2]